MKMDGIERCVETYYPRGDVWHAQTCGKPAKVWVTLVHGGVTKAVCGVHRRAYAGKPHVYRVEAIK
ncbi:MAG TPA: hypothetical protein VFH61_00700 [Thermoleophilia bacterium]|nr:hypothetical protein [Thermoleophilia bacterium]